LARRSARAGAKRRHAGAKPRHNEVFRTVLFGPVLLAQRRIELGADLFLAEGAAGGYVGRSLHNRLQHVRLGEPVLRLRIQPGRILVGFGGRVGERIACPEIEV
jgi:NAD(P)H-dependent flavin oxidoreductase YrpB (nitropropane dioxygenase family)